MQLSKILHSLLLNFSIKLPLAKHSLKAGQFFVKNVQHRLDINIRFRCVSPEINKIKQ